MSWEQVTEAAVHNGGFWLAHLNYVAFWVLLALAAGLLAVRLALQHVVLRRRGAAPVARGAVAGRRSGGGARARLRSARATWRCGPTRPSTGRSPPSRSRPATAARPSSTTRRSPSGVAATSTCTRGSPPARCRPGVSTARCTAIATARRLPGGDRPDLRVWSARALEATGRSAEAAGELEAAAAALPPGPQRDALEVERARVLEAAKGGPR